MNVGPETRRHPVSWWAVVLIAAGAAVLAAGATYVAVIGYIARGVRQ
jgi:hypothetical protein